MQCERIWALSLVHDQLSLLFSGSLEDHSCLSSADPYSPTLERRCFVVIRVVFQIGRV
jgi:hypothetical protein